MFIPIAFAFIVIHVFVIFVYLCRHEYMYLYVYIYLDFILFIRHYIYLLIKCCAGSITVCFVVYNDNKES